MLTELKYAVLTKGANQQEKRALYLQRQKEHEAFLARCMRRDAVWRNQHSVWHLASNSHAYMKSSYDHGKWLLALQVSGTYNVGSDGAPNWPDPPLLR